MSGTRSKSGLMCSHGSELDTKIPRPKMPRTALPPELRRKMGFEQRGEDENDAVVWKAGAGVLAPTGSAPDGNFLKKGSGVAMSTRASGLAVHNPASNRAHILRPRLIAENGEIVPLSEEQKAGRRRSREISDIKKQCVSSRNN